MIKIGINGFGRIGRALFRIMADIPGVRVCVINDIDSQNRQLIWYGAATNLSFQKILF